MGNNDDGNTDDVDIDTFVADIADVAAVADDVAPPPGLRAALLASIAGPWWAPFVRRASALLDLDVDAMKALFQSIDDGERWMPGAVDGLSLFHIDGGPAVEGAITGFVRLAPGATFPEHTHQGFEDALILQGSFIHDGVELKAGMEAPMSPSSSHVVVAGPEGCVYLGVSRDGIDFGDGDIAGPDDPRA
jgi:putative transcriptional regulator